MGQTFMTYYNIMLSCSIMSVTKQNSYYPYFTEEKTKAQQCWETCPWFPASQQLYVIYTYKRTHAYIYMIQIFKKRIYL